MAEYRVAVASQLQDYIRGLRKSNKLTQAELGTRLGLSQRMVAKLEAHPDKASFDRILSVLSALDADLIIRPRGTRARNEYKANTP